MLIAVPPLRSMRRTQASAASALMSLQATLAPYFASARAMPLPMLGPAPVTMATLPSKDTSINSLLLSSREAAGKLLGRAEHSSAPGEPQRHDAAKRSAAQLL